MSIIAVSPIVMKNAILKVAADNHESAVSSVVFTPTAGLVTIKGLTPTSVHSQPTTATWTCDLSYMQDWSTVGSLARYLFDNEGKEIAVEFRPVATGPGFSATVYIAPGSIGGQVDAYAVSTVSLGVKGRPALLPAA